MNYQDNIALIIPSLEPDDKLLSLIKNLSDNGFSNIILVNDGSSNKYNNYFNTAREQYNCKVLVHATNQGKGRAIKTALNYILTENPNIAGAITVDSDGQHSPEDIKKCCDALSNNQTHLILGCRDFYNKDANIPFRSKVGNIITGKVLNMLCSINIRDTQTGLRGFSRDLMNILLNVEGERFEYEMNMLLDTKEYKIPIKQVPIKTIYIEENKSSHFNPLLDSFRIYSVFFKFVMSSFVSFLVDIIMFSIFVSLTKNFIPFYITFSAYIARAISSVVNYTINKNTVFKSKLNNKSTALKYIILCFAQITISGFSTKWLFDLSNINVTLIKVLVDLLIFMVGFQIQKGWIFK